MLKTKKDKLDESGRTENIFSQTQWILGMQNEKDKRQVINVTGGQRGRK